MSNHPFRLTAPLAGWSSPLEEVPDEVFATRMLGDGVAIDPTAGELRAPCDGELILIAAARHAVTLRAPTGCEVLLHVGIDTVGLAGVGFTLHAAQGQTVRRGELLLSFDLDLLARRAKSLLTPVIVAADGGFRILRRVAGCEVAPGDVLLEVERVDGLARDNEPQPASGAEAAAPRSRRIAVGLEHGIHARPAAMLAAALKPLAADVRLLARGREANARSTVALMALGVQHGDEIEIRASGPDAARALDALAVTLSEAAQRETAPTVRQVAAEPAADAAAPEGALVGVVASRGLAVGQALQLQRPDIEIVETGAGVAHERAGLERARAAVRARLTARVAAGGGAGARAAGDIATAHLELLDDPQLTAAAQLGIDRGKSAAFAWRAALREAAEALRALSDPRLRERVDDLLDLEAQVLVALGAGDVEAVPVLPAGTVVIARELLPSQLAALDAQRLAGICMAGGGATSHVAILAAAMEVPALVALGPAVLAVPDGTHLVLDAERGRLELDPPLARLPEARAELAARAARRAAERAAAQCECRTADGERVPVFANVGSAAEAEAAVRNGAEGCGLLRTEFLFLERATAPEEAEQRAEYQKIADALGGRPLTIRTLDAGGDKPIAYLPQGREDNPALGLRGVRTSLAHPQLLRTQLRAILGVRSAERCRILLPMITDPQEVRAVRALLEEEGGAAQRPRIEVGVMIETPASALLASELAGVADFFSIGTNDLTQYTLAMDRTHPQLAPRLDALHPAVLRLIAQAAAAARAHERTVAVCGGLASEPLAAPLLIGLGVQELSAVGSIIPQLKARIAQVTLAQCRALAQRALAADSAPAVRALLREAAPVAQEVAR